MAKTSADDLLEQFKGMTLLELSDFISPAIRESMTSRDSRVASAWASAGPRTLPSM